MPEPRRARSSRSRSRRRGEGQPPLSPTSPAAPASPPRRRQPDVRDPEQQRAPEEAPHDDAPPATRTQPLPPNRRAQSPQSDSDRDSSMERAYYRPRPQPRTPDQAPRHPPAALGGLTPTGPRTPSATRLRPGALGLPCSARSAAGWCVAQGMRPATSTHCRPTCAIPAHAWPQRGAARARSLASSAGGSSPPKMNGRATSTAGIAPAGGGGEPATYLPITASYLTREALAAAQVHGRREKRARAGH